MSRGGPLAGLKVIEMAGLGPCPLAGQLIADLGATVIVVDRASGDRDPADVNRRNKLSVALDLKRPEAREAARRIIASGDVLIEGFRPGTMERLGLGPDVCLGDNPRLVYGRMTGWGQTGPLAARSGHDLTYLALTGALAAIGPADRPPVSPLNLVADYGGGAMFLIFGVLAALVERERSGQGQVIDAAMIDGVSAMMGVFRMFRHNDQWSDRREDNLLDGGAPFYRCYETSDGKAVAVGPIEPQFHAELNAGLGLDPPDPRARMDRRLWPGQGAEYAALFRQRTRDEWASLFADTDACVAPVLDMEEAVSHPQQAARGSFLELDGVIQAAPAPRFDRTPAPMPQAPRAPGSDGEACLRVVGYSDDEIGALRESGALT
jgi:alpha-methylacyl-CoA racemase